MKSRCYFGDSATVLQRLIKKGIKVQTCVTSPPYWGLRDYGVEGQLGLEPTPDEYVEKMVEVFRLVRDLLTDDGTLWLNLGDSYAGSWKAQSRQGKSGVLAGRTACAQRQIAAAAKHESGAGSLKDIPGLKPKDLVGIPWRVAFALQADGWYLRSDIIWHKPNPMPESVTDRPTKAHEYIFLLTKSRKYYYDTAAIREPAKSHTGRVLDNRSSGTGLARGLGAQPDRQGNFKSLEGKRNARSVWTVTPKPYKGAHFAVYPPELIRPCILAGSRTGDVVLDPFFGSGTTGEVCKQLGRKYIGIELNKEYDALQKKRLSK